MKNISKNLTLLKMKKKVSKNLPKMTELINQQVSYPANKLVNKPANKLTSK